MNPGASPAATIELIILTRIGPNIGISLTALIEDKYISYRVLPIPPCPPIAHPLAQLDGLS